MLLCRFASSQILQGAEETDSVILSRAEEGNDSNQQDLPSVWFPCFLVLFSSVSHIHQGRLGCGWEITKFKGTNNKVAFAALLSLSGSGRKGVCVRGGGWLFFL